MSPTEKPDSVNQQTSEVWKTTHAANLAIVRPVLLSAPVWLYKILSECRFSVQGQELCIICPCNITAVALALPPRRRALAAIAYEKGFRWISIFSGTDPAARFVARNHPTVKRKTISMISTALFKQNTPMGEVISHLLEVPYSASVVRLHDSVCLFTNNEQHRLFTGLDPAEYLGRSVANLWIPEETERLLKYLDRDGQVVEYEYTGYRKIDIIQGIQRPIAFVGDFWVVEDFFGHRCRVGLFRFK